MKKEPKGLIKSSCVRLGKEAIREKINQVLKELPNGFYYQFSIEAFSEEEYLKRDFNEKKI